MAGSFQPVNFIVGGRVRRQDLWVECDWGQATQVDSHRFHDDKQALAATIPESGGDRILPDWHLAQAISGGYCYIRLFTAAVAA